MLQVLSHFSPDPPPGPSLHYLSYLHVGVRLALVAVMPHGWFHWRPAFGKDTPNQAFPDGLSTIHLLLAKTKLKKNMGKIRLPVSWRWPFTFSNEMGTGTRWWRCSLSTQSFLRSRLLTLVFPCHQCAASCTQMHAAHTVSKTQSERCATIPTSQSTVKVNNPGQDLHFLLEYWLHWRPPEGDSS